MLLDQICQEYLHSADASCVMAMFDENPRAGKEILRIIVSKKVQGFSVEDQKAVKVLAHNLGI
jgi:hypothetical protein